MILRWIAAWLKWTLTLGLVGGLFSVAYWVSGQMRAERLQEGDEETIQSPQRTKGGIVDLGVDGAKKFGLEEEAARSVSWTRRLPAYGQVIPNPKATAEVRSPFAGTLRASPDAAWPAPGQRVHSGQLLGWVDIRVSAQERLALLDNLNNARLKKEGAEKVVQLQRARVSRVEKLSRSQIVPGQQLDDARVLLAEAETQQAIAAASVELWQKAVAEVDRSGGRKTSTYSQPLLAPADGEVTDLAARPGMAIEAGGLIAQVVDFRRPLVRLDIPPELLGAGPPTSLQLLAIEAFGGALTGITDDPRPAGASAPMQATLVGPAPRVDDTSQFVGYWYAAEPIPGKGSAASTRKTAAGADEAGVRHGGVGERKEFQSTAVAWRPGLVVKAYVTSSSATVQKAVAVPAGAVLFHQGRPLVYVSARPGAYTRREVRLLDRDGDSWVLAARERSGLLGVQPGELVVRSGAQVLLSEEFRGD
ncbi:MAG: efflux RND transporter periplasmic adaptor subunit [Isosphaeraceae bacterium]